jgi:hypothetical protein
MSTALYFHLSLKVEVGRQIILKSVDTEEEQSVRVVRSNLDVDGKTEVGVEFCGLRPNSSASPSYPTTGLPTTSKLPPTLLITSLPKAVPPAAS